MEEEALAGQLGALVRRLRLSKGYSQEVFAQVCGIERAYMSSIEQGKVNVSVRTALKLSRGLDMRMWELFWELEREHGTPTGDE